MTKNISPHHEAVASWRGKVADIEAQLREAQDRLAVAAIDREEYALDATSGDTKAAKLLIAAREASSSAATAIEDLSTALSAARKRLYHEEQLAAETDKELRLAMVTGHMKTRIEAGVRFDAAVAELQAAYVDFVESGRNIQGAGVELFTGLGAMSGFETAFGSGRVVAAMPDICRTLYPGFHFAHMSLAGTERALWHRFLDGK